MASCPSLPIHTAAEIDGVYPTIQASVSSTVLPCLPWVPVLLATERPSSSWRLEYAATPSVANVTSLATSDGTAWVPASPLFCSSTAHSLSVTLATKNGSWWVPPLANAAKPAAWSIGPLPYSPMPIEEPVTPDAGEDTVRLLSSNEMPVSGH